MRHCPIPSRLVLLELVCFLLCMELSDEKQATVFITHTGILSRNNDESNESVHHLLMLYSYVSLK